MMEKTKGFLMFSGFIEMEHWAKIGSDKSRSLKMSM